MKADASLAPLSKWQGKIYSGGWKSGGLGIEPVLDKASGEEIATIGVASVQDVAEASAMAAGAQVAWAAMPSPLRGDILRKLATLMLDHTQEIADWLVRETGSSRLKGTWEAQLASRVILEGAMLASQPSGLLLPTAERSRQSIARRTPIGVVGVITPWNSPFTLACRALAPALATGNAVILKPDLQTPVSGGVMLAALAEAAGLPEGLLQVMFGGVETGEAIVKEPRVRMVSFTGSTRAGRRVGQLASEQTKRVSLELGGNNAYIVMADADVERAANAGSWGAFFHQGQICTTVGRHIVHETIVDEYTKHLAARAGKLTMGDPFREDVQLGPIINERQAKNVEHIVADTIAQGATLVTGGKRNGLYFEPTVLTGVKPGMPAFDEEIFGPVAPIVSFSTDEDAIQYANLSNYGLSAAVVCPEPNRARNIADRLHAGMVHINDHTVVHEVYGPVGGVGASGNGWNYGTTVNADQFTEWQWLTIRNEVPAYPF